MRLNVNSIKILMAEKGYDQSALARAADLKPNVISVAFRKEYASIPTTGKIAKALSVPVEKIIIEED